MVDRIRRATRDLPWQTVTTIVIVLVSIGGIFYAHHTKVAADGGRGGAIGCAITFFMLFTSRATPANALDAPIDAANGETPDPIVLPRPTDLKSAADQVEGLKDQIARLRAAVAAMIDQARSGRFQLAFASMFSTMMWGFGDCIAMHFGAK